MSQASKKNWRTLVAIGVMLVALFAYVASLDESDPESLAEVGEAVSPEGP